LSPTEAGRGKQLTYCHVALNDCRALL